MRVLLVSQYYPPEEVGIGVQLHQLTTHLKSRGHQVTVVTAFPNYPKGAVFPEYRGRVLMRELIDGVEVIRTYIYASPKQSISSKMLNFASFCASSVVGGVLAKRADAAYCVMPPLPLGLSAEIVGLVKRTPTVVNVQDIYPDIAVELGVLRNRQLIRFFQAMERRIYDAAAGIAVISEGFRANLLKKGVAPGKLHVVPNWVDPDVVRPGPRDNAFRREVGLADQFTLVYSGSLSFNSNLAPIIEAARSLRDKPFAFVIVGEGVRKAELQERAREYGLTNVHFLPFQPLEKYPKVLACADMNLVTLNHEAALASVPSKVMKMMASGRPVLAISPSGNEIHRLVTEADCGVCVPPDDPPALAAALTSAADNAGQLEIMGRNARTYVEMHLSRDQRVAQIEEILTRVACK